MNLKTHIFIAKRLTLSKQNKGIVHIISLVALAGIAVGTFALVVVLSVFNGFTGVAQQMLEKTCPPLLIESAKGKTLSLTTAQQILSATENTATVIPVVQTTAMITVGENRSIVTVMGIDSSFFQYNHIDSCLVSGREIFDVQDTMFCLAGINLAAYLGLHRGAEKMNVTVKITVPASSSEEAMVLEDKLSVATVFYQASFQTHSEMDDATVFISLQKAQSLLGLDSSLCTSLYVLPQDKNSVQQIKNTIERKLGTQFTVKTILEQEPVYFRIVSSEKFAVYIILSFIIFIAAINIVSALIILHIQKQKMNKIMRALGMRQRDLRTIYFNYGMVINIAGCLLGILLGLLVCVIQQRFGVIKLAADAFVVDAFPVQIMAKDIITVCAVVMLIGALSVHAVTRRLKTDI